MSAAALEPPFVVPRPGPIGPPASIDVWRVSLLAPSERLAAMEATLTADERAQAARYATDALRRRFVVRRGALRAILARYVGREATGIAFQTEGNGRPRLASRDGSRPVDFNATDSEDLALVAVASSDAAPVGIDVECLRPTSEADAIARDHFSEEARERCSAVPPGDARTRQFFVEWTRVEAAAKAIGVGITGLAERRADIHRLAADAIVFTPAEGMIAAVVAGGDRRTTSIRWWDA